MKSSKDSYNNNISYQFSQYNRNHCNMWYKLTTYKGKLKEYGIHVALDLKRARRTKNREKEEIIEV